MSEFTTLDEVVRNLAKKTVCVDFDGVLAEFHGWLGEDVLGNPYPMTRPFLETIKDMGYDIVVHTVRKAGRVWDWLYANDMARYIEAVTSVKPPAFAYIDDRSICFEGDHNATLWALHKFKAHWEK